MKQGEFGKWAEEKVAQFLGVNGWDLLESRAWFREGEIDLVMRAPGGLRFVEVKARRGEDFGPVVESLTTQKVARLGRAIFRWREKRRAFGPGELWFCGLLLDGAGRITLELFLVE